MAKGQVKERTTSTLDYEFEIPKSAEHLIQYYNRKPFGNGSGLIVEDGKWGIIDRFRTTTFEDSLGKR